MSDAQASLDGRPVLGGVSALVEAGELAVVVGPNGAGKTSLIRAFAGLLPLTGGVARLGGEDVRTLSARARAARAAYLAQDRHIAWNMPAIEVAALGAPFLSSEEALARGRQALITVEAAHLAERGVAEMSGGERARVLLARALATDAKALLVDEPVAGLDPDAQLMVLELLGARARAGQAVLVSLHDLTLAARYADRVVVMDRGRVVADAVPVEALNPDILHHVFGLSGRWIDGPDGPLLASSRYSDGSGAG
ncbi:MAG: ABC transporter ATP-binding protein [Brevundimonas sp.]|nr:MAG: ABC transporter ATP-binding protein [Brevundimonas sp.]